MAPTVHPIFARILQGDGGVLASGRLVSTLGVVEAAFLNLKERKQAKGRVGFSTGPFTLRGLEPQQKLQFQLLNRILSNKN